MLWGESCCQRVQRPHRACSCTRPSRGLPLLHNPLVPPWACSFLARRLQGSGSAPTPRETGCVQALPGTCSAHLLHAPNPQLSWRVKQGHGSQQIPKTHLPWQITGCGGMRVNGTEPGDSWERAEEGSTHAHTRPCVFTHIQTSTLY